MAAWVMALVLYFSGIGTNYGIVDMLEWTITEQEPLCVTVYEGLDNNLSDLTRLTLSESRAVRKAIWPNPCGR